MRNVRIALALGVLGVFILDGGMGVRAETPQASRTPEVTFRLASTIATAGYERLTIDGATVYVAGVTAFSSKEVNSAKPSRSGSGVDLQLDSAAASTLKAALRSSAGARLALFMVGKPVAAPSIDSVGTDGQAVLGGLSSRQAARIIRLLNSGSYNGPVMNAVASRKYANAGEQIIVEAFLGNVEEVGAYEVSLVSSGGESGKLIVEAVTIEERQDYLFGSSSAIKVTDKADSRAVGVLNGGTVDAVSSAYLATFTLRASRDARGVFTVNVAPQGSDGSLLRDSKSFGINFRPGAAVEITVGKVRVKPR